MANVQHETLANQATKMHGIIWQTVANAAALAALSIDADDVAQGKVIKQTDTGQFWIAISIAPAFQEIAPVMNQVAEMKFGGNLGDAASAISLTAGSYFVLPAATLTANRIYTLDRNGLPAGNNPGTLSLIAVDILDTTAFTKTFLNGGGGAGNPMVVAASQAIARYWFMDDGTNWLFIGQTPIEAV